MFLLAFSVAFSESTTSFLRQRPELHTVFKMWIHNLLLYLQSDLLCPVLNVLAEDAAQYLGEIGAAAA